MTGKIVGIAKDFKTGRYNLTLEVNENHEAENIYDKFSGIEKLIINLSLYRKKRSLNANAYLWVLCEEIAKRTDTDKWDVYINALRERGVFTHIVVKESAVERVKREWRATVELGHIKVGNMEGIQLQCYYGSSSYDSKEMARVIDYLVREATELGIETIPPEELERMINAWKV